MIKKGGDAARVWMPYVNRSVCWMKRDSGNHRGFSFFADHFFAIK